MFPAQTAPVLTTNMTEPILCTSTCTAFIIQKGKIVLLVEHFTPTFELRQGILPVLSQPKGYFGEKLNVLLDTATLTFPE